MEALLAYDSSKLCCDAFWLHLENEDKMFRQDNDDAKFVYTLEFNPPVAQKYGWDSAVFKASPFVDIELEAYNRLADLQGKLIPRLYRKASLQIRERRYTAYSHTETDRHRTISRLLASRDLVTLASI
jgi:hypothetical protein